MTTYIIDTETTGFVEPQVIELAWIAVDEREAFISVPTSKPVVQRFKPTKQIELGAMATHHIQIEDLLYCPPSRTAALPADAEYIIGHNVDFDWKVLRQPNVKRICTEALARSLLPTLDSHRLGALLYHFCPDTAKDWLKNAHSAGTDVEICECILNDLLILLEENRDNPIESSEELWQISEAARIPKVMTFGKHKGTPVELVPAGYVSWYLKQDDPDPYLVKAFQAARNKRR